LGPDASCSFNCGPKDAGLNCGDEGGEKVISIYILLKIIITNYSIIRNHF
jgi:hypothetical protein